MSGPWEQYQAAAADEGPWSQFAEKKKSSKKTLADEYAGEDVGKMGAVMRGLGGAKAAFDRAALGVKGLLPQSVQDAGDAIDRYFGAGGVNPELVKRGQAFADEGGAAATVGGIGADIAMSAPVGGLAGAATKSAPLLARALAQVAGGAGYGAATSPEDRTGGALGGGVGTAVGMGVNRLIGGAIKPFIQPEAQAMMKEGIQPTIGQAIGGGVNTAEQKMRSLPLAGNLIRKARERATGEFNTAVGNRALSDIGESVGASTKPGSALTEEVANKIGGVFDRIEPNAKFVTDPDFTKSVAAIRTQLSQMAPEKLTQFDNIVQNQIADKLRGGAMNGEQWAGTREMLNRIARQNKLGNPSGDQLALADSIGELQQAVIDNVVKNSPANIRSELANASSGWRQYKQMEKAAGMKGAMNNENVFTPSQYLSAVRGGLTAGQRAQGKGTNTEFAQQAQKVLGDTVPDSGTAGRLGMMDLLVGGATGGAAYADPTGTLGAAALLAAPYTRAGSKFAMQGVEPAYKAAVQALTLRGVPTQAVDEALRKYGPQGVISLARSIGVNTAQQ